MRGPEALGPLQLLRVAVDRHDGGGTGQRSSGDRSVAHAAATEHGHRVAPADLSGVDAGAEAGHDPATEQACDRRVGGRVHLGALPGRHQGGLGECADAQGRRQWRAIGERHGLNGIMGVEAVLRPALGACPTLAAHRPPIEHHEVAHLDLGDALADRLDDAGGLVAEQKRKLVGNAALAVVKVGVTHPAGLHGHAGLAGAGVGHDDVGHLHRCTLAARNHSTNGHRHRCAPSAWSVTTDDTRPGRVHLTLATGPNPHPGSGVSAACQQYQATSDL